MNTVRPKLADIARHAGVSIPTVSKVLNGRTDVATATRERIVESMHELGYTQRVPAALKTRGGVIDILIGGMGSLWSIEVLRGAEAATARSGRSLVVTNSGSADFNLSHWLETLISHRSEGVIIVTSIATEHELGRIGELNIPVVQLDPGGAAPGFAQIGATNWAGSREATQHLIDLGHTRIGFIGGPERVSIAQDRLEGYTAALRRNGIDVDRDLIRWGDFMTASGERGAAELLDLENPPTAIFASSDLEAMGVYHEAAARGLSIPRDLSVIGFDDTIVCEMLSPSLTTVRQPLAEMADQSVRLLADLARAERPAHPRIELSTSLIKRHSTGAPRA